MVMMMGRLYLDNSTMTEIQGSLLITHPSVSTQLRQLSTWHNARTDLVRLKSDIASRSQTRV